MRFTVLNEGFHWKITHFMLLLVAAFASAPDTLRGAAITWGPATAISGDSDVINTGVLAYAYDWNILSPTVNGVNFTGSGTYNGGTNVIVSAYFSIATGVFASSSNSYAALSTAYKNMLGGADFSSSAPVPSSVTLENLTIGHIYSVQVWVNDPRGPYNSRSETITSPGGNTNTLKFSTNTLTNPGGPGQYAVGTFTADATNQTFTLTGDL